MCANNVIWLGHLRPLLVLFVRRCVVESQLARRIRVASARIHTLSFGRLVPIWVRSRERCMVATR